LSHKWSGFVLIVSSLYILWSYCTLILTIPLVSPLVLKPSSLRISVSGDIMSLEEPKSTWLKHFESLEPAKLEKPLLGNAVLTSDGERPSGKVLLMSMPSIESSYAYHVAKGKSLHQQEHSYPSLT